MNKVLVLVLMAVVFSFAGGCGNMEQVTLGETNPPAEIANQLGDVMATIDEAGRGTVAIARRESTSTKTKKNRTVDNLMLTVFPHAQAATCNTAEFSSCSANSVTRNFNSCTVGGYVLTGSVAMTWTGAQIVLCLR